jgi:hypothetical protein
MTHVWQIGGGPASRSFVDVFLRHGVGLIGPGDAGRWRPDRSDSEFGGKSVRRFATLLHEGSIIVLRSGNATVCALGLVASDYDHLEQFDDVNGWDLQHTRRVLEDEILVHLVVPFLRALGWRPEQIAIKWRRVDVALFRALPRKPENCHLIIEAKYPGAGIERALKQARRYARTLQAGCNLLVTDGFRYRLYAGGPDGRPLAYANLLRLKKSAADLFERLKRP